jgi:hypothetical protein
MEKRGEESIEADGLLAWTDRYKAVLLPETGNRWMKNFGGERQ